MYTLFYLKFHFELVVPELAIFSQRLKKVERIITIVILYFALFRNFSFSIDQGMFNDPLLIFQITFPSRNLAMPGIGYRPKVAYTAFCLTVMFIIATTKRNVGLHMHLLHK